MSKAASLAILAGLALAGPAGAAAVLVAPGPMAIEAGAAPAFAPDGNIVYIGVRVGKNGGQIVTLTRQGEGWSAPTPAAFSDGSHRDLEPAFAPSGRYLVFASSRSATPGQPDNDGHFNGALQAGSGGALWRVDFKSGVPGAPTRLPDTINSVDAVFSPALTANGALYFMRADGGAKFHIFRAEAKGDGYAAPTPAGFTDPQFGDYDPAVAPDESFVIFSSGRPPAPKTTDLFISFRKAGVWGAPIDLREALSPDVFGIEARLSPDARTLYFTNSRGPSGQIEDGKRYLWKIDLTPALRANGALPAQG